MWALFVGYNDAPTPIDSLSRVALSPAAARKRRRLSAKPRRRQKSRYAWHHKAASSSAARTDAAGPHAAAPADVCAVSQPRAVLQCPTRRVCVPRESAHRFRLLAEGHYSDPVLRIAPPEEVSCSTPQRRERAAYLSVLVPVREQGTRRSSRCAAESRQRCPL